MLPRSADELRAEMLRQRAVRDEHRRCTRQTEALACEIIIQTLAYALGETPAPTTRTRR